MDKFIQGNSCSVFLLAAEEEDISFNQREKCENKTSKDCNEVDLCLDVASYVLYKNQLLACA